MRDTYGLLPPHIRANHEREEMVDRQIGKATALWHVLQGIDHRLDVVFVTDRADAEWGVVPGRWHVVRKNDPPAPDSYIPITTEDGGYREPDMGVAEEMRRRDLWNRPLPLSKEKPSALREAPETDEGMVDELVSDIKAGHRLPGDGGLTKRLWGKK